VRIDKFLFFARVVKTRGLAQDLVSARHMRLDGRVVERAHAHVRVGSVLTFALNDRVRVLKVEALPNRRGPAAEARACYSDLSPAPG
jgi:ribosome-associated heat shock protein Hsp15